jgi:hypothetical protein
MTPDNPSWEELLEEEREALRWAIRVATKLSPDMSAEDQGRMGRMVQVLTRILDRLGDKNDQGRA